MRQTYNVNHSAGQLNFFLQKCHCQSKRGKLLLCWNRGGERAVTAREWVSLSWIQDLGDTVEVDIVGTIGDIG